MNRRNAKCVVLCAGRGSRLIPFSLENPKAMLKIKEKPILGYVIDYWKRYADSFIFVVRFKKEEVIEYVRKLPIDAEFVEQREPRGIADAVSCVEDKVPQDFILVLGDCICRGDFSFPHNMQQGVGVWQTANPQDIKQSFSVEIKNEIICKVEEKPRIVSNNLCGMGFYFFNNKVFNHIKLTAPSSLRNEVEITDVIQNMIDAGEKIAPVFFTGDYLNITYADDLQRAERILAENKERKPMKIAFFHNIPSGGAKRSHYEQIKLLSKGHSIDLYTLKGVDDEFLPLRGFIRQKFEFALEYINFPKPLFFLSPLAVLLNLFRYERLSKKIAGKIDEGNYEIVFVARDYGVAAPSILRYIKTPAVYYCQEPPRDLYDPQVLSRIASGFSIIRSLRMLNFLPYRYICKKIDKRNTRCAARILVNSRFSKKIIDGIYGIDTQIIYHGVDTEKFKPRLAPKENMVISVGALHWRKGHGFIIESLSRLKDKPGLIIVADRGGRVEEERLLALAAKGNVDVKIYKNITSDEELIALYGKAKLCVCAPLAEPLGLVALEAMACGVPVVAVNEGGLSETVINGETGILTERDLGQFSQAIARLINDDELRNSYAQKAREYVIRKWQWSVPVNQLEGALSSCCSTRPQCNICEARESKLIFNKEGHNYFVCKRCGLVYIFPRPSQKELIDIYEDLSKKYYTAEFKIKEDFNQSYQGILNSLEQYKLTGRLLEIGCSTGSALVAAQKKGWLPFGTEISRQSASYGISQHQLDIFIGELYDAHFPDNYFDAILLIQTLEHLEDPDGYIQECHRVLRKGGALFISVPNFKGVTCSLLKKRYFYVNYQHLFYFSPKSIKTLLSKRGFRITRLNTQGLDLFNMALGRVFDLNRRMETQRTFLRTSSALRKNKFLLPVRFLYKLFTFPLCYLGGGDGVLLYAEKK